MTSLLRVFIFVALAPLATGVWRVIDLNREALATSTQQFQLLLASSIAEKVDFTVAGMLTDLEGVARAVEARTGAHGNELNQVPGALAMGFNDRVRYLRYDSALGRSVSVGPLPDELEPVLERFVGDVQMSTAGSDRGGDVVFSRPIVLEGAPERSVLLISIPTLQRETGSGRLSVIVDLRPIWEFATARNRGGNVIYALDARGRVFASTDPSLVSLGDDMRHSVPAESFISGHGLARETMPFTETEGGVERRFLGSYETTSQGWGVFVRSELRHVYSPVFRLVRSTVSWMLIALGITSLFAVAFALSLSRPITKLARASRAFARGEFSTRVHVRARNEIGELAHTFNGMATEIEGHIARLEVAARENSELFEGTILALANAIDAKDRYTRGHSVRVNEYSVMIARELELSAKQIHGIHVAALLHDVGKIGIDDAILKKPGVLTPEEFAVIQTHAELGANIMAAIPQMKDILPGLRWHHERMDGTGYPDALCGRQIPLMARIIAVADTFDAVTSDRSYQRTRSFSEARELLHELKGQLDPDIVDAFDRLYDRGEIGFEAQRPRHMTQVQTPIAG